METLIASIVLISIAIIGMSAGVIFSNKALKGSCGGLGAIMGEDCDFCEKKDNCQTRLKELAQAATVLK